jgi:hypothetical protein
MKEQLHHFKNAQFRKSLAAGLILLTVSLFINFYAGVYATQRASNSVTDIILSNIRVYDLDGVFIYGTWVLVLFIVWVCISRPKKSLFIIKTIALFVLIRAVFITLTHIGPFPTQVVINPGSFLNYFIFGGDLFFSGHTGLPFLMSLIFLEDKRLHYIFLAASCMFAVVVLLSHLHYTIDVLSAFFISYGIFHIALKIFKKDKEIFDNGIPS